MRRSMRVGADLSSVELHHTEDTCGPASVGRELGLSVIDKSHAQGDDAHLTASDMFGSRRSTGLQRNDVNR